MVVPQITSIRVSPEIHGLINVIQPQPSDGGGEEKLEESEKQIGALMEQGKINRATEEAFRLATTEKELFMKRLSVNKEVDEAIARITAELGEWKAKASKPEQERDTLIQESSPSSQELSTPADQEFLHRLEYENIEPSSKVLLLDAQLQLKSVMQKDFEVHALEQEVKPLKSEKEDLQQKLIEASKAQEDFDKLSEELDGFELRCTELDHKLSMISEEKEELERLRAECDKLGKVHNDMEALKDKVNSLELRSEELDYNIEQQKEQNSELASNLDAQVEDNEDMKSHKRLSD